MRINNLFNACGVALAPQETFNNKLYHYIKYCDLPNVFYISVNYFGNVSNI